jgi:hypothetical protein
MGFCPDDTVYRLKFVSPAMRGLIVEAKEPPLGIILDVMRLGDDPTNMNKADLKSVDELFHSFVQSVVSWNMEDKDGTPVPITMDGLGRYGLRFALDLAMAWANAGVDIPAPLGNRSTNGLQSGEVSIPMESL